MKVQIYIDADGLENLAKGREVLYWSFSLRKEGTPIPPATVRVGECELLFPSTDKAAAGAIAALNERKARVYVEAAEQAKELDERIQNLLALPAPEPVGHNSVREPAAAEGADDDIPF